MGTPLIRNLEPSGNAVPVYIPGTAVPVYLPPAGASQAPAVATGTPGRPGFPEIPIYPPEEPEIPSFPVPVPVPKTPPITPAGYSDGGTGNVVQQIDIQIGQTSDQNQGLTNLATAESGAQSSLQPSIIWLIVGAALVFGAMIVMRNN